MNGVDESSFFVKLIDFGSSCQMNQQIYPYIQSRFYRAPEVILRAGYEFGIDMWSFGCLIAELIKGLPIFAGDDEFDQLACIMEILGLPDRELIRKGRSSYKYFIDNNYHSLTNYLAQSKLRSSAQKISYNVALSKDDSLLDSKVPYLPRYCELGLGSDGRAALRPGWTKPSGQIRGTPGSARLPRVLCQQRTVRYEQSKLLSKPHDELSGIKGSRLAQARAKLEEDTRDLTDLLCKCLCWSSEQRIQPAEALQHHWFNYGFNATMSHSISMPLCLSNSVMGKIAYN
ncbi:hypothetical protein Ciccas_013013 [Cichlidogyrus casuarinus]|uniref:Protein kinase domain-containing protein n=1 Tax=Cichlidogyrus casuarinus TaxID=1844966 RepID=A0ABD2PPT2_9PLAT